MKLPTTYTKRFASDVKEMRDAVESIIAWGEVNERLLSPGQPGEQPTISAVASLHCYVVWERTAN